jgi:hypothetical protein
VFPVDYEVRGHDGEPQTDYVDVVYEGFARTLERELNAANADLAQRTAERDKTRRLYCIEMSRQSLDPKRFTPERSAKERGWDCFEEEA